METYMVKTKNEPIDATVTVPGSKSVTNRALLMAALSDGKTKLNGVLFSDDSRNFLGSLLALGFNVDIDEENKSVTVNGMGGIIPNKTGRIYVGSAGTAARFLSAMVALSDAEIFIDASEQMKARPMKSLFDALSELGAEITYVENEGFLPVIIKGRYLMTHENSRAVAHVDISKSTQFLSALMMCGCMIKEGLDIVITSEKTDGSYVRITKAMMSDFGCTCTYDGHDYHVAPNQAYISGEYSIEPDISAACYFWAMAAVTGGRALVRNVKRNMMQGDIRFLEVLEKMGCKVQENEEGLCVTGPKNLKAVDVNMNDFSDQTMTLAAIAPYAEGDTIIRGIGHIRLQESDRVEAILVNLRAMGIECEAFTEETDGKNIECIRIRSGVPHRAVIKTFDDHRIAMAFAMCGLVTAGIEIENPMCCRKTFENYFEVLETI